MRRQLEIAAALLFCAVFLAGTLDRRNVSAAPRPELVQPGKLLVAGRAMRCGRTPTLMDHSFWDYGGASDGLIILNPNKLETLPDPVRLYVYAHECGHQVHGRSEPRADCYAVKRGRKEGWLNRQGLMQICDFLEDHPGDYVHPPGPQRCRTMAKCYDQSKPPQAGPDASG
jgi:hypothetical protein